MFQIASLTIIHREWFPGSGNEAVDANLVSHYLDTFEGISRLLLQAVVNLTDENVSQTVLTVEK